MSVLNRIAIAQGRRDETPNQELARALAEQEDRAGIRELVANLQHADQDVRSDCLKTLYEVGYRKPKLIADYTGEFVRLLRDRHNRMVWGSMIALSTIAPLQAGELYPQRQQIQEAMAEGSVITVDNGVKVLAAIAAADATYQAGLLVDYAPLARYYQAIFDLDWATGLQAVTATPRAVPHETSAEPDTAARVPLSLGDYVEV